MALTVHCSEITGVGVRETCFVGFIGPVLLEMHKPITGPIRISLSNLTGHELFIKTPQEQMKWAYGPPRHMTAQGPVCQPSISADR